MINALMTAPFRPEDLERLGTIEGYRIVFDPAPANALLAEAEVIIGNPPGTILSETPKLRWLQDSNAGVDDYLPYRDSFLDRGIALTNVSGVFGPSISEHVLVMTLMLYKHMHLYRDQQHTKIWRDAGREDSPMDKNILILGVGNIGSHCAMKFRPFGCHITGLCRSLRPIPPEFDELITMEQLDASISTADIVVGALPATPETKQLLDRDRLGLLKPTALLINVGRGNLIDCAALAEMLSAGKLAGVALDVTSPEPLPADHPLWDCPNAIITPHISGITLGHFAKTEELTFDLLRRNLAHYRDGEPLLNLVDFHCGFRRLEHRF